MLLSLSTDVLNSGDGKSIISVIKLFHWVLLSFEDWHFISYPKFVLSQISENRLLYTFIYC